VAGPCRGAAIKEAEKQTAYSGRVWLKKPGMKKRVEAWAIPVLGTTGVRMEARGEKSFNSQFLIT